MEYEEFLRERRKRMADIIRVAFRQLGGEQDAPPVTPPWFLPGAETVWQRIAETERASAWRVREVYAALFGDSAAGRIEDAVPDGERQTLARNLAGARGFGAAEYRRLPLPRAANADALRRRRLARGAQPVQRCTGP